MKTVTFLAAYLTAYVSYAAGVNDIHYMPLEGEYAGATSVSNSQSTASGTAGANKVDLTSNYTLINQQLGLGLLDDLAVGVTIPLLTQGTSSLKVANKTISSADYTTGLQSPTLGVLKRFKLSEELGSVQYVQFGLDYNIKDSDSNKLRSDYYRGTLSLGYVADDSQKFSAGISAVNYNADSSTDSQTHTALTVAYQKTLPSALFFQAVAAVAQTSTLSYKTSTLKVKYGSTTGFGVGIGKTIENTDVDWLAGYTYQRVNQTFEDSTGKIEATNTGGQFTLGIGYKL